MNADTLRRLAGIDMTAEALREVLTVFADIEGKNEERRAKDAARKKEDRDAKKAASMDNPRTIQGQSKECPAEVPSEALPEVSPKDNIKTPSLPSQSSLRSDLVRLREQFDRFMAAFPKRTNRKAAWAKFQIAARSGVDPERMIAAAGVYAAHVKFTDPQFIKAPDAWLNAGKYDDELPAEPARPPPARAGPFNGAPPKRNTAFAVYERLSREDECPSENPAPPLSAVR